MAVIFGESKNSKIQNGRHFWGKQNFLKIAKSILLRYPVDRKFRRNRSISHGLGDRHIYVLCYVAITQKVKAITINNNTKQAIDPINLQILQRAINQSVVRVLNLRIYGF